MRNKLLILILASLISLSVSSQGLSLSEPTHQALNEYVAQHAVNGFSLNDYLINNLGFQKGVGESINGFDANRNNVSRQVFWWISYGGEQEDRPGDWYDYIPIIGRPTRSVNHFHNPLPWKSWDQAGLDDYFVGHRTGKSQVLWAQDLSQDPNGTLGGKWSWYDARKYLYSALTGKAFDDEKKVVVISSRDRDAFLANTFRAVGQLMHLVEDASVPEHVRNQIHLLPAYEAKVELFRSDKKKYPGLWDSFLAKPIGFDKSVLNIDVPNEPFGRVPISRIIDTDNYTGTNPESTATLPNPLQPAPFQPIGLSEYTNANFLSKHTMFTDDLDPADRHYFPFPRGASAVRAKDDNNKRWYVGKAGEGDPIKHLAAVSWQQSYVEKNYPDLAELWWTIGGLDEECYKEYASNLIPRAVGYSAGLLEYFFRGSLRIIYLVPSSANLASYAYGSDDPCTQFNPECQLAIIPRCNDTSTDIDRIHVGIQNNSKLSQVDNAVEPIGPGTLTLMVSYADTVNAGVVYQTVKSIPFSFEIPDVGTKQYLGVVFSLDQPIPTQRAKDLTYYFTFRGKLGKEQDAVVGAAVKAPVLQSVSPNQAAWGTVLSVVGNGFSAPVETLGPDGISGTRISFPWLFSAANTEDPEIEVINSTDSQITVKVPQGACYNYCPSGNVGGLRVLNILPNKEWIYSNPLNFTALDNQGSIFSCSSDPFVIGCCGYGYYGGPALEACIRCPPGCPSCPN